MKMARASEADVEASLTVVRIIEDLLNGYMPVDEDADDAERFDEDDGDLCIEALQKILTVASKASMFRVVFGMTVVLDPRNELLDPDADTIELHPKLAALQAENAKLREALLDATAHLCAAASAYQMYARRSSTLTPKAKSDALFTTRASDFEKAAKRARAALSQQEAKL